MRDASNGAVEQVIVVEASDLYAHGRVDMRTVRMEFFAICRFYQFSAR